MYKLYEACIVHSNHDYVFSTFFEKFMEWIGINCFNFTYCDSNAKLKDVVEKDHFDFVLYINDKNGNWKNQYARTSDVHVDINTNDYNNSIWCSINDSTDKKILNRNILINTFKNVVQDKFSDSEDLRLLFNFFTGVYCKHNIMHKILADETNYDLLYNKSNKDFIKKVTDLSIGWDKIIAEMEFNKNNFNDLPGFENYLYALIYSKWKSMKVYQILGLKSPYDIKMLSEELHSMYTKYDGYFYMLEILKSNIMSLDYNNLIHIIFNISNAIELCSSRACTSSIHYKMGHFCDLVYRPEKSIECYQIALEKNPSNFQALFRIANLKIDTKNSDEAETTLKLILKNLQVYDDTYNEFYQDNVKHLPLLEMEYACRCFLTWESIKNKSVISDVSRFALHSNAREICDLVTKSDYLKHIYENNYKDMLLQASSFMFNHIFKKRPGNPIKFIS